MFYVSIVNFGDLLTKGHSGCWIQMTFKALSVPLPHGLLEVQALNQTTQLYFLSTFSYHSVL